MATAVDLYTHKQSLRSKPDRTTVKYVFYMKEKIKLNDTNMANTTNIVLTKKKIHGNHLEFLRRQKIGQPVYNFVKEKLIRPL